MKKISQGKYEIFTTKQNAIDKFMQMQGVCREKISGEKPIQFYCTKKGKIIITNPPTKRVESDNSTKLFAEILEQDNKVYVAYYTSFSKLNNIFNSIFLSIYFLMAVLAIVLTIYTHIKMYYLPILFLGFLLFGFKLFSATKEEKNSPIDSEILIKELEKRVESINKWDK